MKTLKVLSGVAVAAAGWRWWVAHRREARTMWAPPGGTFVTETLPARVVGEGRCRAVLLHGIFNAGLYWGARFDRLAEHGRLVVPDLLGFGRSPRPATGYTADAHADAVADTLRACGADGPVVVGAHSVGSLVALRLAVCHPDLVSAIVAFAPPFYPNPETARRQIAGTDPLARLLIVNEDLSAAVCRFMCRHRRLSAALVRLFRPTLPAPLAADRVEHSWASYHGTLKNLILAAEARGWVADTAVPIRLLAGARDAAVDLPFLHQLADAHPHVTLRIVDDADHDLPLSHPELCITELDAALTAGVAVEAAGRYRTADNERTQPDGTR